MTATETNERNDQRRIGHAAYSQQDLARLDDNRRRTAIALVDIHQLHLSDYSRPPAGRAE